MKQLLVILALLALWQCTPSQQTVEEPIVPPGVAIQSVVTTGLDWQNRPLNNVGHLPDFLDLFFVHTTFTGLTNGPHVYHAVISGPDGMTTCQDPAVPYEVQGGVLEAVTKIQGSRCLIEPGEYTIKLYLDFSFIIAKKVWRLTPEETKSGTFEPYWNKNKYVEVFPAATSAGGDWQVMNLSMISADITNVFVTTHLGYNRIFYVHRNRESHDYNIMEHQKYGGESVYLFPNGVDSDPRNIRYYATGDKVYFYNKKVLVSYDLNNGDKIENDPLPISAAPDNGFDSPSHERWVSTQAALEGKQSLVSSDQYCNDPTVMWASWDESKGSLYYWIECGQGSDYGFFVHDLINGKSQRVLDDFQNLRYPFSFQNNGTNFVAFVEQDEGGDAALKIATQASYPEEMGFGQNFNWNRYLTLPATVVDGSGVYLKVEFYQRQDAYLSFEYGEGFDGMAGQIKKIGRIKEGDWTGKELYRLRDYGMMGDKGESGPNTVEYTYLIKNENEMIAINGGNLEQKQLRMADLDGKRSKSGLFNGVTTAALYTNLYIEGLHSPPLVDLPNSNAKLKRLGVIQEVDESGFTKLFEHATEGPIFVREADNGSFWRFNGDGTGTLYEYQYNFESVTAGGTQLGMQDYVPYTNLGCTGAPLDMAHIIILDTGRLAKIGTTNVNEPIFGFASAEDELLKKDYDALKEAYTAGYDESERPFKSMDQFIKGVPLFVWKDPFGRYVRWIRREYLAPSNCEPILYLYPEKTIDVTVELGEKVKVFNSIPLVQSNWQLTAHSDGTLISKSTTKSYNHIFWEGISGHLPPLEKGFVVDTADLRSFFNEKLMRLGLNAKETKDFQDAWLKDFKDAPYYFIGFYDHKVIDWYAPMTITPAPSAVIRILMDYRPLEEAIYVESPVFGPRPERKGFVAVEWAGVKRFPVSGSRIPGQSGSD